MTVVSVSCFLAGGGDSPDGWTGVKLFLLVKVTASDGSIGWGEAYVLNGREAAVGALLESLGAAYLGLPTSAAASIPMPPSAPSSWRLGTLTGKCLNAAPLYSLLGGALGQRIPLYANLWSDKYPGLDAIIARNQEHVAAGFHALKLYPFAFSGLKEGEALMAKVREAIGLMVDLNGLDVAHEALRAARRFEAYDLFWFKEPSPPTPWRVWPRFAASAGSASSPANAMAVKPSSATSWSVAPPTC